ncbi:DUF1642 domain-containing protein [Streptococcus parauberis]|uniref:Phage protein n=1 Tax=Streptococcus parauberis NCFD 2020 TaxID=873447 RepID=F1Z0Q1_9STRE|nr:DUF1642 domain-containing protein [Streptococcus parauberis]EGE53189.1 hypothetical protein SPB_0695 [Streptococcus parauberis NCFD 2020]QBX18324.1 hypothetical protein Javan411_0028 [Streptococcus phage Javan411]QBX27621.1 hypothetical protein Javan400_0023 [Streptococcus phage Javan400]
MNKKEAKEAIKECQKGTGLVPAGFAINILDQLDQPKTVVPKFVAEWYEEHKEDLEYDLYLYQMSIYDLKPKKDDFYYWMEKTNNPVRKLINMHQFGYTVEKEKLYTVEIPNPNDKQKALRLEKWVEGKVRIVTTYSTNDFTKGMYLTEEEIRKDFDWAFRWAKEVTE